MTEIYMLPIQDQEFVPDTLEKCYLLFRRLGEIATDAEEDYPGKSVWAVWETPDGTD